MKAMIFAAGLGTRFKPWTDLHPKALAIVNNKSLLQRNVEYLQRNGISDIILNVHHFADQVIDAIQTNKGWGSHIVISDEQEALLETGGGLLKAKYFFHQNEPFLIINADILTDLSIPKMLAYHQQNNALITLATSSRLSSRNLLFNTSNRLCGWENRTTGEQKIVIPNQQLQAMAYNCVGIFEPNVFELITQRGKFSLTDTYLSLAADYPILAYRQDNGNFIDVGKPESVTIAEMMFP